MASTQVERPVTVDIPGPAVEDKKDVKLKTSEKSPEKRKTSTAANHQPKKIRHDNEGRYFKFGRKRAHSFSGSNGKYGPPHKRWKGRDFIVPPTKFLLGGNICDPLNLNSLQDEEINRAMNAVTPHSSPVPTPRHRKEAIEVLIPPNIHDPLNLSAPDDDPNYELKLISPKKKKPRNRRKKGAIPLVLLSSTSEEVKPEEPSKEGAVVAEEAVQKTEESPPDKKGGRRSGEGKGNDRRPRRSVDDKIVSPVIPQPGGWKHNYIPYNRNLSWDSGARNRKTRFRSRSGKIDGQQAQTPNFKPCNTKFQYGNYNRYYGYRNPNNEVDTRMKCFRKDMFQGKEVLDIGCNVGHITLSVAQRLGARKVVGIDIDRKLIDIAKKNIRHYASCVPAESGDKFPACMPVLYGTLDAPIPSGSRQLKFPQNVSFVHGNYVLESDALLSVEKQQFDVIMALSITKWIHLNWGDSGLKRTFRRIFAQLRPGGKLILEPQGWSSYNLKKKLTETIFRNYKSIEFFPNKFTEYLLTEVGFSKCEVIGTPQHHSKGFQRPIQVFTKAEPPHNSPSENEPAIACGVAALPTDIVVSGAQERQVPEQILAAAAEERERQEAATRRVVAELPQEVEAEAAQPQQPDMVELGGGCKRLDSDQT